MKNKKVGIIIGVIVILILVISLIVISYLNSNKEEKNSETTIQESSIKPYVEENNIKIVSSNEEFKIPFKPYARDKAEKKPVDLDGVVFEDTIGTYRFYDYSVSDVDENNYVTHTFKYDVVVPISCTVDTNKVDNDTWSRSYAFLQANVFDYYTGELYYEKNVNVTENINHNSLNDPDGDMAYTNVTWNGNEYRIGIRMESSASWDGTNTVESSNGIEKYTDTNRITMVGYVYAPKDFDGLVIALNKNGTTKEVVLKQIEFNKKYNELLEESQESGEKSEELIEMEQMLNKMYKLLDKQNTDIKERSNDDFYVIRVNEIPKQGENNNRDVSNVSNVNNEEISLVKVLINGKEYELKLEDNETVRSFIAKLPQEFNMTELNGNEKYVDLDFTLPTNSYNPNHIEAGDVMLYGDNCLVIFYKSFDTQFRYTKIGHIDNLDDLGSGNIKVLMEK